MSSRGWRHQYQISHQGGLAGCPNPRPSPYVRVVARFKRHDAPNDRATTRSYSGRRLPCVICIFSMIRCAPALTRSVKCFARNYSLLRSLPQCYLRRVKTLSAIRGLLGILAIIGLALAPIGRPAMAMPAATHGAALEQPMAGDGAMAMPEDMPCCPKKAPIPDCKDCLFAGMCAAQFLGNLVLGTGLFLPFALASVLFPGNDTDVAGLSNGPPPRPPKT